MADSNDQLHLSGLVVALCVGQPQAIPSEDPRQSPWMSGIFKRPVDGPLWLGKTNLVGDRQADLRVHGGPDKAALVYAASHYPLWREELELPDMTYGGFGENFTVEGLDEAAVCLGDAFSIGEAKVQISQPRQPCGKLSRRWRIPTLNKRAVQNGRLGWYLRVLEEGNVQSGQTMRLLERPLPNWTIGAVNHIFYFDTHNHAAARELAECPLLAECWREVFAERCQARS